MKKLFVILLSILFFSGCVTLGIDQNKITQLEKKIAELEKGRYSTEGAGYNFYPFTAISGGGTGSVDKVTGLADKDVGFVALQDDGTYGAGDNQGNAVFFYTHDAGASAGDNYPWSIDSGDAGTDWELMTGIFAGAWLYNDLRMADTYSIKTGPASADYFSVETTDDIGGTPGQVEAMRLTTAGTGDAPLMELGDSGTTSPKVVVYLQAGPDAMANEGYSGIVITGLNAGEAIPQGNLVYWHATDKEWHLADADDAAHFPARGVALGTGENGSPLDVLVQGVMRHDDWTGGGDGWTAGDTLYLDDDPGDNDSVDDTAPSTANDCVQVVGFALTVDEVYFNFSGHWLLVE